MNPDRRDLLAGLAALLVAGPAARRLLASTAPAPPAPAAPMYGRIGRLTAVPGQRDALAAILLDGVRDMPGCLSYVVAADPAHTDALWITEVWTDEASHAASLALPAVRAAIAKGRPLIAAFESHTATTPLGGHGLAPG